MATGTQTQQLVTVDEMTFACGIQGDHAGCQKHRLKVLGEFPCKCPCHDKKAQTVDVDQQLAEARAKYQAAKEKEDRLYAVYVHLPLSAHPLIVDEARMAYLQASDVTLALLCEVARLQAPENARKWWDGEKWVTLDHEPDRHW